MASPCSATRPEDLSAQYADRWVIYRDLSRDGTHDEWVAEARQPVGGVHAKVTADDIGSLAEHLLLQDLREAWAPQWCVWRSRGSDGEPNCWCATRRGEGREMSQTLMADTADELKQALASEGRPLIYG